MPLALITMVPTLGIVAVVPGKYVYPLITKLTTVSGSPLGSVSLVSKFPVRAISSATLTTSFTASGGKLTLSVAALEVSARQMYPFCDAISLYRYPCIDAVTPLIVNTGFATPLYGASDGTLLQLVPPLVLSCHW